MTQKLKILVVDDQAIIGELFKITLGYKGHEVIYVQDPRKVAEAIGRGELDIAFIDIVMPNKDGLEVLKEVREFFPKLPVIMMSGYSMSEQRSEAMRLGAMMCLQKPFAGEEISKIIKDVVMGRKA